MARRRRDTPPPDTGGSEKETLLAFLDYLRDSVITKAEGAPEPAAREPGVGSGTNVLGLVKHLAHVERFTFLGANVRSWPATFHLTQDETAEQIIDSYRAAIADANEFIARCTDLGTDRVEPGGRRNTPTLRWALVHMIEETGRHAGHTDILRELIDGSTGR